MNDDAAVTLARFVASTEADDIPPDTLETARIDLLDTLGCAIAGERALGVAEARSLITQWAGPPISSIWGSGTKVAPPEAAFVNAMSGHALDYDDQHPGVLHTGVCVVPAALAMAEAVNVTRLRDVLAAVVLGTEVADRISVATVDGPGVSGWLLTPLCGHFGAAAAAAKVAGSTLAQIQHAIGFAYVQTSGNGQVTLDGAIAKRMQPAFAARGGVFGAALAGRGLTAPVNALEGVRGFFHVYHKDRYEPSALTDGLGDSWLIDRATFKPYPCSAWTHAALECGVALFARGIGPNDVRTVDVAVNSQAYASTGTPLPRRYEPQTAVDAQFSIPYTVARAVVVGSVALDAFADEALGRRDVIALAAKVRVRADAVLDAQYGHDISPALVDVVLADGSVVHEEIWEPRGRGDRPLSHDDIVAKFRECCAYAGRSSRFADRVVTVVLGGDVGAVPALCNLLREAAG